MKRRIQSACLATLALLFVPGVVNGQNLQLLTTVDPAQVPPGGGATVQTRSVVVELGLEAFRGFGVGLVLIVVHVELAALPVAKGRDPDIAPLSAVAGTVLVFGLTATPHATGTIALMMSLGFITRYGGTDATLGLAFTRTGFFYPFFAAMLGWLGVALTGSDTSSNVLFGSLQKITAQQLNLNPVLICAANSTGGVMGKMIDAQSIVVATASTGQSGGEGKILRMVFWHSLALAGIMGLIVMLQAYVFPWMIPSP